MQKIRLRNIFTKKKAGNLKFDYDRSGRMRPAWVTVNDKTRKIRFITLRIGGSAQIYFVRLFWGVFLPIDFTKEEMIKYYEKVAEIYDAEIVSGSQNLRAIAYTAGRIKKLVKNKDCSVLDVGAGTGLGTEALVKAGFSNVTMLDYSKRMLAKARKKKALRNIHFVAKDFLEYNPRAKFDLITSFFSFPSSSYYSPSQIDAGFRKVEKLLNKGGIFAMHGFMARECPRKYLKEIEYRDYELSKKTTSWTAHYVGKKK